ncbi:hypothetical protein I3760_08G114500 [Carya illinoinensis]|nr:hypothetical protein I3760_08G114500 [Carya illinoinensis]
MDGDILGAETDYLLLPATAKHQRPEIIDWHCVNSVLFSSKKNGESHLNCSLPEGCARTVQTKDGPVRTCLLQNSLVYTPHTDQMYCTTRILELNANSRMQHHRRGKINTYKEYYEDRHGIKLLFEHESLVSVRHLFGVKKHLQRCRNQIRKESSMMSVELPPELCSIIRSPISINTFYSFSFVPSIMHRLDSLLIAAKLKKMHLDHCAQNDVIPISKGFIRDESFDPNKWIIPGDRSGSAFSEELLFNTRKIYIRETMKMESETIADVVEALIGAFLSIGGETSALLFMEWLGIKVDFHITPYERPFRIHVEKRLNVRHLESLLNYSFRDPSLLVEALTHGNMLCKIPRCNYQRLEFLGDSVLDYLMTKHFYYEYPGLSQKQLTDIRAASVNNECYARSAVKFGLHKHILRDSQELDKQIVKTCNNFEKLSSESTFGWDAETTFTEVLSDIIESLAGAILVDSGYNMEIVFGSIRPLLEPLIIPEMPMSHPVKELKELHQKEHYNLKETNKNRNNNEGLSSITVKVDAKGLSFEHTATDTNGKTAKKLAYKEVLKSLKENIT